MAKIKDWRKVWESQRMIRYQNDKDQNKRLEIGKEYIDGKSRWFVYLITSDKIYDFPINRKDGGNKKEALQSAYEYMRKN